MHDYEERDEEERDMLSTFSMSMFYESVIFTCRRNGVCKKRCLDVSTWLGRSTGIGIFGR